jgi:hypothetical protein
MENCNLCGHTLENNSHGFDQNDAVMTKDGDCIHLGSCTYCRYCNLKIDALLKEKESSAS